MHVKYASVDLAVMVIICLYLRKLNVSAQFAQQSEFSGAKMVILEMLKAVSFEQNIARKHLLIFICKR